MALRIKYQDLDFYKRSREFVKLIYLITKKFPKDEMFGLTSQIRRASVSIPNNIAEGSGRNTTNDLKRFLTMSCGSAKEVENLIEISKDLCYISEDQYQRLKKDMDAIIGPLVNYIKSMEKGYMNI